MKKVTVAAGVLALAGMTGLAISPVAAAPQAKSSKSTASDVDQLLAPVALYPDTLLAQILLCAGDPPQVVKLNAWLADNTDVKGTALQDAATVDGFEPSFVALALFPQVVKYMADRGDWTTRLGKAFAADKTAVFDSIQRLRKQAQASGALKDSPQQNIETKTTSSGDVIIIEPANPQIIYVPQYNPQVVYTQPTTTTVVVKEDDDDVDAAVAGLIGFTAGIALGAAIDNDYYYGPYGWHGGAYMYNDAWDDYYDAREDAREDWTDHREDLVEERGERGENRQGERTERTEARQENRPESQAERTQSQQTRQENRPATQSGTASAQAASTRSTSGTARASSTGSSSEVTRSRSGTSSDAFGGYSSGGSARAASSRGSASRGASRGGGGRRR